MNFQETLEKARYEVSIELYPNGAHYQIYKPDCPVAHCWEVYRSPRTDREDEVKMDCDSLDEAIEVMHADIAKRNAAVRRFSDAMDTVCGDCMNLDPDVCDSCMVRKTYDLMRS